jgi:hypothetical protein
MFPCELVSVGLFAAALGLTIESSWGTSSQVVVAVWPNEQYVNIPLDPGGWARYVWRVSWGYWHYYSRLLRALSSVIRRGS